MNNLTDRELMQQCVDALVKDQYNGVTGAYIGEKNGRTCIVCQVPKKEPESKLVVRGVKIIPRRVRIAGHEDREFQTDVVEAPSVFKPMLLRLPIAADGRFVTEYVGRYAGAQGLQDCQSPTIPGGSQIAPQGAGWVGTDGCALRLADADSYGYLTNWHVAVGGQFGQDSPQCQPHGQGPVFGYLRRWWDIDTSGGNNLVDCAYIEDRLWKESGGRRIFGEPEQFQFGTLIPDFYTEADINVGLQVQKSGRTTGHTTGRVVGIGATVHVGYDHGTAKFIRQVIIEGDSGQFSGPGDSGSLICDMQNRPVGLLFAGGGGQTIANVVEQVVEHLRLEFWSRG